MDIHKSRKMKNKLSSLFIGIGIAIGAAAIFGFSSPKSPSAPSDYGGSWQMLSTPNGTVYYYSTYERNAYYLTSRKDLYDKVTWHWAPINNY